MGDQASITNARVPANEIERLEALHRCGILDSEPEPTFDEIASLAGQLCATPIPLVTSDPNIRFYAGVPLTLDDGLTVGTLWSLGVTAYELLTGRLPFDGGSISEVCSQVLFEPARSPLLLLRPELAPALCDVVLRCLCKDRELRFATAEELAEALLGSLPAQAVTSAFTRRIAP